MGRSKGQYACLMVPFPPTTNNLFANDRGSGRYRTAQYKLWRGDAQRALRQQSPLPHFQVAVSLVLTLGRPDKRRRDISNYIKAPEDALVEAGILDDDSQVEDVRARWSEDVTGCMIEIEEIGPLWDATIAAARAVA